MPGPEEYAQQRLAQTLAEDEAARKDITAALLTIALHAVGTTISDKEEILNDFNMFRDGLI